MDLCPSRKFWKLNAASRLFSKKSSSADQNNSTSGEPRGGDNGGSGGCGGCGGGEGPTLTSRIALRSDLSHSHSSSSTQRPCHSRNDHDAQLNHLNLNLNQHNNHNNGSQLNQQQTAAVSRQTYDDDNLNCNNRDTCRCGTSTTQTNIQTNMESSNPAEIDPSMVPSTSGMNITNKKKSSTIGSHYSNSSSTPGSTLERGLCPPGSTRPTYSGRGSSSGQHNLQVIANECWICYDNERTDAGPLIRPCVCSGDVSSVHHDCLKKWLVESYASAGNVRCRVCKQTYQLEQGEVWLPSGITASSWFQTAALMSVMSAAVVGACMIVKTFEHFYIHTISVGLVIVVWYVCLR